ncbi:MAG: TetR family transcriptional regulator, partial [Actinobacteria bacterium]|nr:TetR family transcriptional regulator [Actinomycetota bacterium]
AVTIEDIADHAQVAVSTVYKHFKDKDALISATMLWGFAEWGAKVHSLGDHLTDPLEKLVFPMRLFVRVKSTHPDHARNIVNFLEIATRFLPVLESDLSEHIQELATAKLLTCDDPDVAARNIQAVLLATVVNQVTDQKAKVEAADASIRVALRMVGISEVKARKLTESKLPDFKG